LNSRHDPTEVEFEEEATRMRVVIVADNASTQFGGEAFLPFNYFRLLRVRNVDVRLVVHARNRSELVEKFPADLDRLFFVEDTTLHKALFRLGNCLPTRFAEATTGVAIQLSTQLSQRQTIRNLQDVHGVDIVHQPIPVSPKAPSMMFGVGAAVVVGPLNGGMEYPEAFRREHGMLSNLAIAMARGFANYLNMIIPGKRRASLVLVANRRTRAALPSGLKGRVIELVENGVDFSVWRGKPDRIPRDEKNIVRFVFVGRLIDWKAIEIILEAMQRIRSDVEISLEIIGDGPMRKGWQILAEQLGLSGAVTFSGWMSQQNCAVRLQQADVFLLPSLFECGGAVVLEAMAMGLPVVATAWGGPVDYLDDSCGILVSPVSREALISGFANSMKILAQSPSLRQRLGLAGLERARQHFDWERKIDQILDLYRTAVSPGSVG
jgi:glycosyltransferase involved in cell wall biosynthesis